MKITSPDFDYEGVIFSFSEGAILLISTKDQYHLDKAEGETKNYSERLLSQNIFLKYILSFTHTHNHKLEPEFSGLGSWFRSEGRAFRSAKAHGLLDENAGVPFYQGFRARIVR